MADENKTQLLDGFYRSRDALIANVKELSLQIRQLNIGSVLFLLIFIALIFNENFKPSSWQKSSDALKTWKKKHGKSTKFLSVVSYRQFQRSADSAFFYTRRAILKSIKGKVSPSNSMAFYQNQLNKGFTIKDIPVLKNELDTLYNTQSQLERYQEERQNIMRILDSLTKAAREDTDTLPDGERAQRISDLQQSLPKYNKQLVDDSTDLKDRFNNLKTKYSKINLLLVNDQLQSRKKIDTIQAELKKFEEDKEVMAWQDMERSHPQALRWPYKTWQILNNANIVKQWGSIFKNLNYEDSLGMVKRVKQDTSFVFNQVNIREYIESQLKNKQRVPTTEFFGTKIPLPTKQILVILPLLIMALVLALQVLGLQRRVAEIRIVRIEQRIKEWLQNEELVCTNIFGQEVMNSTPNIKLLLTLQFTRLFENNADAYKDIIFSFANVLLFIFMANKWLALVQNDPKLRVWAIGLALVGGAFFLFVYLINWRISRKILNKVRMQE